MLYICGRVNPKLIQIYMETNFIDNLRNRKTNFPAPEEAIDKANACNLLSRDIYTDNTRFLYELLQNADDASCKSGVLKFHIDFIEDYMIVSHEGKPFNEDDIESICSIGDGSKSADSEQTGFKGIGFKSVFAYSDFVIIKSGDYCFKFDKQESSDVWLDMWGNQEEWQQKRKLKNKSTKVNLPWQIIPINSLLPDCITSNIVNGFNVSTIIRCKKINELKESVKNLFSSAELILFLRSQKVEIIVNTDSPLQIVKQKTGDVTSIARDGEIINEWLMHTTIPFEVPSRVREQMEEDKDHYPEKLREATKASISFAISIRDGRIEKLDSQVNNIYSFLPTSVKHYKFPFIVNSNFITDAGRQNLHQDYVWNQWLFESIPNHFLNWISNIASSGKYGLDFLKVISLKSGATDELGSAYNKSMKEVLPITPILPNTNGTLTTSEAILDKTSISSSIDSQFVIRHLNNESTAYCADNILSESYLPYASKLKELGAVIFDEEELKAMISAEWFIASQSPTENSKLICFLSAKYAKQEDSMESLFWLQNTPFLFTQSGRMLCPPQVCFPNLTTNENGDVDIIHSIVFTSLQETEIEWLKIVGVKEISDTSIIDTGKIFKEDYITTNNAISVGRYLFKLHKKGVLDGNHYTQLKRIKILTQHETLLSITDSYLPNIYKPNFALESHVDIDFFVSAKYIEQYDSPREWGIFLERIGAGSDLSKITIGVPTFEAETTKVVFQDYVKEAKCIASQYSWISWEGWDFSNRGYDFRVTWLSFSGIPYLPYAKSYDFARLLWNKICSEMEYYDLTNINDSFYASGTTGMLHRTLEKSRFEQQNFETSYIKWVVKNAPIFPATDKKCYLAKELFANTIPNIKLLADSYLPIIDIDEPLKNSWVINLGLKTNITIDDYLTILTKITDKEQILTADKDRISKLYNLLAEQLPHLYSNDKNKILEWGKSNKVFATDGKFYPPTELVYTTLDGFTSKHLVYTGRIDDKEKLVELLKLFGVKIYTEENIEALCDIKHEDYKISKRLLSIVSVLALLASEGKDKDYFENKRNELQTKISQTTFYSCNSIQLVFRDSDARADRLTYAVNGNFYFVGDISPAKIEPLLSPLSSYLGIKRKERELLVLMTEPSYDAIVDFLKEKEYNTDWLISNETALVPTTDAEVGAELDNGLDHDRQLAESNEAKSLVLAHLESKGFDVSNVDRTQSTIHGLQKDRTEYPLVVKSYKDRRYPLRLNPAEWHQLFKPNSMLWIHLGGGIITPIKAYELFTYQDKLTLSFDTINIMLDDRVDKIMQVMRYFNNVHLNLSSLNPDTRRADNLDEYSFHSNNLANSDLGEDTGIEF